MKKLKTGAVILMLLVCLLLITPSVMGDANDRDGDGLDNQYELWVTKTDPDLWDSDGDGLSDSEDPYPLDPTLPVISEMERETTQEPISTPAPEPISTPSSKVPSAVKGTANDRDGDGWDNQYELWVTKTDPDLWDTDGDGLSDPDDPYPFDPAMPVDEKATSEPTPTPISAPEPTQISEPEPTQISEPEPTPEVVEEEPVIQWSLLLLGIIIIAAIVIAVVILYSRRNTEE